jgi:heterodisulfide reductase subunit A-like polyferredoxin
VGVFLRWFSGISPFTKVSMFGSYGLVQRGLVVPQSVNKRRKKCYGTQKCSEVCHWKVVTDVNLRTGFKHAKTGVVQVSKTCEAVLSIDPKHEVP